MLMERIFKYEFFINNKKSNIVKVFFFNLIVKVRDITHGFFFDVITKTGSAQDELSNNL